MNTVTTEIMTFRSGENLFGLPIQQVLTITGEREDLHCKAFRSKETLGISEYQGIPVAIVDLAKANNVTSINEQKRQLIDTLKMREQDHIDWLNALEDALTNDVEFTKARDPHMCAFGKWYDSFKTEDEDLRNILNEFDSPHKKIHSLADKLLDMKVDGKLQQCLDILNDERETTLKHLISLFDRVRGQIMTSIKTVFIFLTIDSSTPCVSLCVDEISDVETVADDGYTSMSDMAIPLIESSIQYLSGYQKLASGNDCLLIDLELLLSNPALQRKASKVS